jgi:hypothetical protein
MNNVAGILHKTFYPDVTEKNIHVLPMSTMFYFIGKNLPNMELRMYTMTLRIIHVCTRTAHNTLHHTLLNAAEVFKTR